MKSVGCIFTSYTNDVLWDRVDCITFFGVKRSRCNNIRWNDYCTGGSILYSTSRVELDFLVDELFCRLDCRKKCGKVKTDYKRDYFHSNIDVDFDFAGPVVHGAWVLGYGHRANYFFLIIVQLALIVITVLEKLVGNSNSIEQMKNQVK